MKIENPNLFSPEVESDEMIPVIQMWQPWASWVVEEWKTIETRTHNLFAWMVNKRVAIHACKTWDKYAIRLAMPYLTQEQINKSYHFQSVKGVIIGTAFVSAYRKLNKDDSQNALIDCHYTERNGLFLTDVKKIKPIPFKGAQRQLFIQSKIIEVNK